MKLLLISLLSFITALPSLAQLKGDGYYRVQNFMSKRYVYVTDNKGKLNYQSSTADMYAIQLWMDFEKACSDPATVCYIEKVDDKYDIKSQGTGVHEIIDSYVSIRKNSDGTYYAYGSKDGITKYLSDGEKALSLPQGVMSDAGKGEWRKWNIIPFGTDSDNFFGIKPTINVNGSYYTSFYTAFPYSFASSGINAYYIYKVSNGYAVMREITGTVPAYTPVFVKVSSDQPASNKLNIGGSASAIGGNLMKGVFFNNDMKTHYNRTAYNAKTMRMLGIRADGTLGFVTSNIDFIPANHSYLQVPEGTPAELKLITEDEYNKLNSKKPESITFDRTQVTLLEGEKTTLVATVLPEDAFDKSLTWVTNNPAIALMDNGTITAVKEGIVNVTATTVNGLMANCEVIVKKPVMPESISLDRTQITLVEGEKTTLVATILPEEATNKHITWVTNNPEIALMDNGTVTAVKEGIVNVTATTDNGLTANCEVIVKKPSVLATSITLDKNVYEAVEGTEFSLTATILPEDASSKTVAWDSSNKEVATVTDGLVKVLKEGTANITASTTDGTNLTATCVVNGISGIEDIFTDAAQFPVKIYNASGVYVKTAYNASDFESLAPGIYVAGSKKIIISEK